MKYVVKDGRFKLYTEEELDQRRKDQVKAYQEKMKKLTSYVDKLKDMANKIVIAENLDSAKSIYDDALALYKEAHDWLENEKGMRHFVTIIHAKRLDETLNDLEEAIKQKYADNNTELDIGTELISLASNTKNYLGGAKMRIDEIIRKINKDYDYKLLSEDELRNLKYRLSIVAPDVAKRINDSCKDAAYIDVVKAINRKMEEKSLEEDYLGCNVWLRDESRDQDKAVKKVHVDLGFSAQKNPDDFTAVVIEALSSIYENVTVDDFEFVEFPKRKQYEVKIDLTCEETTESETALNERLEEEAKKKEAERQEQLKAKLAAEEAAAAQAKLEQEAAQTVKQFMLKLAKAKSIEQLDAIFDDIEDMFERKELSESQFNQLSKIYDEAENRLKKGKADNSFFLQLKYEDQIDRAQTGTDVERLRKFIKKNFDEGQMDNATLELLNKKLAARRNKLLKPGFDAIKDAVEYHDAIIEKQPDGYFMIKQLGTVYKTLEEAKKDVDAFAKIYDFKNDRPIRDTKVNDAITLESAKSFLSFMDLDEDEENLIAGTDDDDAYDKAQKWLYDNHIKYAHHASSDDEDYDGFEDDYIEFTIPKSQFSVKVNDIKPRKGESKSDFISRFMSATKSEYPDEKQRLAIAYSYWRNR